MTSSGESPYTRPIQIGSATLGGGHPFVLIAGPALVRGPNGASGALAVADRLSAQARKLDVPFIFRLDQPPGNDGPGHGFDEALSILREVRGRFAVPVAADVRAPAQAGLAAEAADMLHVPAECCRDTELLVEAARTGRPVNIEKDVRLTLPEAAEILDAVAGVGNWNVMLTECGTSFGPDRLVIDFGGFAVLRETGFPLVFNAGSRSAAAGLEAQVPAIELAQAAIAVGVDGIVLVVHDDTRKGAAADGAAGYSLAATPRLLARLKGIEQAAKLG